MWLYGWGISSMLGFEPPLPWSVIANIVADVSCVYESLSASIRGADWLETMYEQNKASPVLAVPLDLSLNEWMYSYTDEGIAHAELLLVTCLRKENLLGNKNFLLPVLLL